MANLKAVKRKMSKWGVLGNAFLSVVLAVSLMPSYAAFGDDGQEESPKATQEQNQQVVNERTADGVQGDGENEATKQIAAGIEQTSQARDYNYLNDLSKLHTPNGGFVWMLGVNTADADMPSPLDLAAGSYGEFFDFAAPADAQAARDAVAALYDGVDESNVSVGTFELPGGKQMPADAELTAWWLGGENADPKVDPSKVRAFSWDGSSLTELAVTVGEEPTGAFGGAKLAQVSPEPGRALVLVDTTSLTEKSQAKAGVYSVTANLYIPSYANQVLPGVQVYMQCPTMPPTVPVSRSATLTIAEDGTRTVHIELSNEPADVFTLQQISGAPGETEIVSAPRIKEDHLFGTDMKTQSQVYGRIGSLDVKLLNDSGDYSFTGYQEFPTILGNYMNMEVRLSVDFSSAVRKYVAPSDGSQAVTKTLTDVGTGLKATVSTSEKDVARKLQSGAQLVVEKRSDGETYENALSDFEAMHTGEVSLEYFTYKIIDKTGAEIALDGNTEVSVALPTSNSGICDVYKVNEGSYDQLVSNTAADNGFFSLVGMPSSGSFAVIDKTKASKWTSKTVANAELGISWTESLTDAQSKYDSTDGGPYAAMATRFVKVGSSKVSDAATLNNALAAIKKLTGTFTDAAVLSGFYCSPISIAEQQVQDAWVQDESKDSISVPRASNDGVTADTKAFLISISGKNVSAVPLGTVVSDDAVSIDVLPSSMTKSEAYARYVALHNGVIENDSYADYPTSFIVLANGAEVGQESKTFADESVADVAVTVASSRAEVVDKFDSARATFTEYGESDAAAKAIRDAFDSQLSCDPVFRAYAVSVIDADGDALPVASDDTLSLNISNAFEQSELYVWNGEKLSKLDSNSNGSALTAPIPSFGTYVLVDKSTMGEREYHATISDPETGATLDIVTTHSAFGKAITQDGVTLKVSKAAEDSDEHSFAESHLDKEYEQVPDFGVYSFGIYGPDGQKISYESWKLKQSHLTLPSKVVKPALFFISENYGGELSWVSNNVVNMPIATSDGNSVAIDMGSTSMGLYRFVIADEDGVAAREWITRNYEDPATGLKVSIKSREASMSPFLKDEGSHIEVTKYSAGDAQYDSFLEIMKKECYKTVDFEGFSLQLKDSQGNTAVSNDSENTVITINHLSTPSTWWWNASDYPTSFTGANDVAVFNGPDDIESVEYLRSPQTGTFSMVADDVSSDGKRLHGVIQNCVLSGFGDFYTVNENMRYLKWTDIDVPTVNDLVYTGKQQTGVRKDSRIDITYYDVIDGVSRATDAGTYTCTISLQHPNLRWAGCEGDETTSDKKITWKIVEAGDVSTLTQPIAEAQALLDGTMVSADGKDVLSNTQWVSQADHDALASAIADAQAMADSTKAVAKTAVEDQAAALAAAVTAFKTAQKAGLKDAGTAYTVTANLSMPGEYNPVLANVTVYVNNPNNPFADKAGNSPVLDGNDPAGVEASAPTTPVANNATIAVAPDGTKTLTLKLPNPVFTLQELGTCDQLPNVTVDRVSPVDKSVWDYGKYDTRVGSITVQLPEGADSGEQQFVFKGSKLYAVPINTDITPDASKDALILDIDYSSAKADAVVDRSALTSAVADAEQLAAGVAVSADGSDVSTEGMWVTQEAMAAFKDAIAQASAVAGVNLVSKQMVADAADALRAAADAFRASMKPGTKDERVKVAKPSAVAGLVYTGAEQTGVVAAEGYTLSGAVATNAGSYTAVATLKTGFVWDDGSTDPVEIPWSIAKATLTATYVGETVSVGTAPQLGVEVTGFVGGETAVSAAGYEAPTVSAPATLEAGKTYDLTPAGGKADNYNFVYAGGKLTVEAASTGTLKPGTYTITANLSMPGEYNPVIPGATVYANNPNNPFADKAGNEPVLDGNNPVGVVSTTPTTPLTKNATLVVAADGTKTLELDVLNPVFTTQELGTCAELPKVDATRKVPADASVWSYGKYDTRISHVSVPLTDDMVTGVKSYTFAGSKLYAVPLDMDIAPTGTVALQLTVNYSSLPASALPDGVDPVPDPDPEPTPDPAPTPDPTPTPSPSPSPTPGGSTTVGTTTSGHFAAGTYTVSANLWFDKATTGLPLNPHLTNGGFPPSTPVSNNATMTVDASGHAWVSAPVVIQDKVMTINNVWGSGVSYDGSTVTIDLGTPTADQTQFAGTCTSSVTIGWLAQTIAAGIFNGVWDHTWSTNWEVDLVAGSLPASGGGELPAAAQAILNGENGVAASGDAAAAALAAAEDGATKSGKAADGKSSGSAKSGVAGAVEDLADAAASNPAVAIALGCAVVLAVAGAAGGAYAYRRKKRAAAAADGAASDAASK